ncbi:SDR family oxidoreductase [Legionella oakridgensis]|uniref:Short-chain dehydrogenase of various substrate specificities n=2 Tax=Legionella oakridgensis TaxID=29423 RepID=W0BBE0_9GAMM|nr:SDR family oxidoreductase [Legionella oakridgensis]AHE67833.1 short-chain dehydrogenase of various substrate specificities [Legionella oakridgensis ATCC 33761 = DSM 21215]ETO92635.1 short-chain dehydrogenase of various substrate specificities [Legionella oakridgensis RV-2-2007]KTD44078.1 short chain dehydrogenase/reductase family transporter protein [Legionella oakridgensis]STY20846.1 short-chain dehydrogenase [Legionella longbeachae]
MKRVLITGSNCGLGLEFVKQLSSQHYHVIATCRHPNNAKELQQWSSHKKNVSIYTLDVTNDQHLATLTRELGDLPIDWVINNAGMFGAQGVTVGHIERDNFLQVFNTNCLSVLKVSDALLPNLRRSNDKLIVCISSRMGSIRDNQQGQSYAYRSSKAALNCAMRSFALDVANEGIQVMLLHPGWVKTDLGGDNAPLDAKTSVTGLLKVIIRHKDNSHAEVLRGYDDSIIDW